MSGEVPTVDRVQGLTRGSAAPLSANVRPRVRVVTDSASDLDEEAIAEHGIGIVQLDLRLGDYGPEVTSAWSPEEFWQMTTKVEDLAETSSPSPGAFSEMFSVLADEGAEAVVCVTLSSKLSGTYQIAVIGAESVADRIRVRVIDSMSATIGQGLVALAAASAAEAGLDVDAVAAAAVATRDRLRLYGALDSLDSLRKGGRLGPAQALLGGLLDIKPILEMDDGALVLESRLRTRSRSLEHLVAKARERRDVQQLAVVHASADDIDAFVALLSDSFPREIISVGWLGPVIGAHVGKGTIAIAELRA
jgi:DegV family protein with EDD domain